MKDSIVKVNGIDLHVADFGGRGETILCVHGLTSNCRIWDAAAEHLTDKYRVIAFDLRGRGDSQKPDEGNNICQHVEDVKGLLDHFGLEKIIYFGHSLGASIGVCFATTYPERLSRLILVDGGADVEDIVLDLLKPTIDRLGKVAPDFETYLAPLKAGPFFPDWTPYVEQHFYFDAQHNPDGSVASKVKKEAIAQELAFMKNFSLNALHSRIKTPTLILWSPRSLEHPTVLVMKREQGEEIVKGIPNSRFTAIEGSNHFSILLTFYEKTVSEVKDFLTATQNVDLQLVRS